MPVDANWELPPIQLVPSRRVLSLSSMLRSSCNGTILSAVTFALYCSSACATLIVEGNNTQLFLSGTNGLPAVVYGYNATNAAIPSTFSTNFLVKGDGTGSSSPITFSTAPVTTLVGNKYFVFVLDAQEPNKLESLQVTNISISVNSNVIWSSTDTILLNSTAIRTLTPTGNGADMAVYIPVAAFNGLNLTGASTFVFSATHFDSSGGNEEWIFTDRGIPTAISFFPANGVIQDIVVPEPTTGALALLSGAFFGFRVYFRRSR